MTTLERLERAAAMMGHVHTTSAVSDEEFRAADEELQQASIAFFRSLTTRKLARIRRYR